VQGHVTQKNMLNIENPARPLLCCSLRISGHLPAAIVELEKCNFRNFIDVMTLTLNRVMRHTVVHHSSTSMYIPNFIEIGKTFFLDRLTARTPPSSRSRDTKTRTNFKNPARANLDIVL